MAHDSRCAAISWMRFRTALLVWSLKMGTGRGRAPDKRLCLLEPALEGALHDQPPLPARDHATAAGLPYHFEGGLYRVLATRFVDEDLGNRCLWRLGWCPSGPIL